MEELIAVLRRCASVHAIDQIAEVLQEWGGPPTAIKEEQLGVLVLTLATAAMEAPTLEAKEDSVVGLECCLTAAALTLEPAAVERLQKKVLEKTLRRFDSAGDELAAKATRQLLQPAYAIALPTVSRALRAILALLFRCSGSDRVTQLELLELVRGDVALAVAVILHGLSFRPAGLPTWTQQLLQMLHKLTTPETFVWLLQRSEPGVDFSGAFSAWRQTRMGVDLNNTPIAELQERQVGHAKAISVSLVQFGMLDSILTAAEESQHRQTALAGFVRTLHNLVAGHQLSEPGRMLTRYLALDFMRLGYRFLAPCMRKMIDEDELRSQDAGKLLRHTCRTLSWLLIHAEYEGCFFLADSLKQLAVEWLLRGLRGGLPPAGLSGLLALAANCGSLPTASPAEVQAAVPKVRWQLEEDARRGYPLTSLGIPALQDLGLELATACDDEADEDGSDDLGDWWPEDENETCPAEEEEEEIGGSDERALVLDVALPCIECGKASREGIYGEGNFDGFWYCMRCWKVWEDAPVNEVALSPWPLECTAPGQVEQRGAAAWLLAAPGQLRCGISGALLTSAAVRLPSSSAAVYPVAFHRRALERWHRRSGGRCPITGQALDLKEATDAADVVQAVDFWLQSKQIAT